MSTPPVIQILVLAGNHQQAMDWCRNNNLPPSAPNLCFITGPDSLRGRIGPVLVMRIGTWDERRDIREIEAGLDFLTGRTG